MTRTTGSPDPARSYPISTLTDFELHRIMMLLVVSYMLILGRAGEAESLENVAGRRVRHERVRLRFSVAQPASARAPILHSGETWRRHVPRAAHRRQPPGARAVRRSSALRGRLRITRSNPGQRREPTITPTRLCGPAPISRRNPSGTPWPRNTRAVAGSTSPSGHHSATKPRAASSDGREVPRPGEHLQELEPQSSSLRRSRPASAAGSSTASPAT